MSIIRTEKNRNYTVICNQIFKDSTISARAKGIFAYLMTLPDDWKIYKKELYTHFKEGEKAIDTAFKELEKKGYIQKERVRDPQSNCFVGWEYHVFETVKEGTVEKKESSADVKKRQDTERVPMNQKSSYPLEATNDKKKYGENVFLEGQEYQDLIDEYGSLAITKQIEELSLYKLSTGTVYKSDYWTLKSWLKRKEIPQKRSDQSSALLSDYKKQREEAQTHQQNMQRFQRLSEEEKESYRNRIRETTEEEVIFGIDGRAATLFAQETHIS